MLSIDIPRESARLGSGVGGDGEMRRELRNGGGMEDGGREREGWREREDEIEDERESESRRG